MTGKSEDKLVEVFSTPTIREAVDFINVKREMGWRPLVMPYPEPTTSGHCWVFIMHNFFGNK